VATATADVAKARIVLSDAEVNLKNATLVAPISGTVAAMPFTAGHAMTTSQSVSIIGSGSVQVSIDVAETAITSVKVGQSASVSASTGSASAGKVTAIGILPSDSSTSSTASYPVTVTVPKPSAALAPGVTGAVSVTVASARNAVVLPVSAVTKLTDTTGTVTLLGQDNQTTPTRVSLGAIGTGTVQITSGVGVGQRVVIADNTAALPSSSTSTNRRPGTALGGQAGGGTGGPPAGGVPGGR
jgi:RND family efflux transporter MFP subunit